MASIQAICSMGLLIVYFIFQLPVGHHLDEKSQPNIPCAVYAALTFLICLASVFTSVVLATYVGMIGKDRRWKGKKEQKHGPKILLTWLIVDVIFILHHVSFIIFTSYDVQNDGIEKKTFRSMISAISFLLAFSLFIPMLLLYSEQKYLRFHEIHELPEIPFDSQSQGTMSQDHIQPIF